MAAPSRDPLLHLLPRVSRLRPLPGSHHPPLSLAPGVREWNLQTTPASSTAPPAKAKAQPALDSSSSGSSAPSEEHSEATPWARRTARKTTSAKHAEHAQHWSQAPVEAAQWLPEEMEPGTLSSSSPENQENAPQPEGITLEEVATALQLASGPGRSCGACKPGQPGVRHLTGVGA